MCFFDYIIEEFGADPDLKRLYQAYLAIVLVGGFLWWIMPVVAVVTYSFEVQILVLVVLSFFVPLIIAVGFILYWIS